MESLNLGILAHVDAGKTSLTERLLFNAGVIDHLGSVDKGDTQTDTLAVERQRGITVRSAVVAFEIDGAPVNLIDTPGHPDFIAEVERILRVLDGAVLVLSAVEGVQPQTRVLMRALGRLEIPTLLFVNKIDREGAREEPLLQEIVQGLGLTIVPMGFTSALGTKQANFEPWAADDSKHHAMLVETLGTHDEEILTDYVEDTGPLRLDRLREQLRDQTQQGLVNPVFFGSARTGAGVNSLTSGIADLLSANVRGDPDAPTSGTVFKIERGEARGKIAYVRLFSGTVRTRDRLIYGQGHEDKVTAVNAAGGHSHATEMSVPAGSIAKVWGLHDVQIGDRVGEIGTDESDQQFAPPTMESVVHARNPEDGARLRVALGELAEQDPLIKVRQDDDLNEISVSLYGEVQKEVLHDTLVTDYGVDVEFRSTRTINVERPVALGEAREVLGRHGNPFLATIGLRVEPGPRGSGIRIDLAVKVESIPLYVFKSVEEFHDSLRSTVHDSLRQGLYGWEVVDCVVTLVECGYSAPGTKASDIRYLTPLVLFSALQQAGTAVCEPISAVRLEVPSDSLTSTGAAVARLGGVTIDSELTGSLTVLSAEVPASDVHRLQQLLPGLSHGEGFLESSFSRYEPVRGAPPSRPRTDNNPLNRQEYLGRVTRRGRAAHKDGGAP